MVARVVIGQLPGGTFVLKSSLKNINVLGVTDDDGDKLSFSSNWTDVAKVHLAGAAPFSGNGVTVFFNALGYIPFCEVACGISSSGAVYDQGNEVIGPNGANGNVGGKGTNINGIIADGSLQIGKRASQTDALYVIYKIQAF